MTVRNPLNRLARLSDSAFAYVEDDPALTLSEKARAVLGGLRICILDLQAMIQANEGLFETIQRERDDAELRLRAIHTRGRGPGGSGGSPAGTDSGRGGKVAGDRKLW